MFGLFGKRHELLAPFDGTSLALGDVPDPVFAQGMVGEGAAVDPTGDVAVAPCAGKITLLFKTNHAFGITTPEGVEVLVHIGVDTVELKGEGFQRLRNEGDTVEAGTPIIKMDRTFLASKGVKLQTPVVITNKEKVRDVKVRTGKSVRAGQDVLVTYTL